MSKEKRPEPIIVNMKNNYSFERVDIFLRVNGRLPEKMEDKITQELLDKYCKMFDEGKLTEGVVPLSDMYKLIKFGKIKPDIEHFVYKLNYPECTKECKFAVLDSCKEVCPEKFIGGSK